MSDADFRNHHIVSTALNIHFFEHRVPTAVYEKTKKKVNDLEAKCLSLEKRLDSVVGTVAGLKKKRLE